MDNTEPAAMVAGPLNLITDVRGVRVGHAQDDHLKSGVSVLLSDQPLTASYAVLGGAPGTRETDLLEPDKSVPAVDALVLSGGSAFGLDAVSGVVSGLRAKGRGFAVGPAIVPIVPGAILFDLINGGHKDWDENPYPALGRRAFDAAKTGQFDLGTIGAGTGALTGMLKGGLGSASLKLPSGHMVGAMVAANPIGSVNTPGDKHFWAAPFEIDGEFGGLGPDPHAGLGLHVTSRKAVAFGAQMADESQARGNTTIAIVATDAALTKAEAKRMAIAAHDGIARAIVPAHSPHDGDLVFAAATGQADIVEAVDPILLGHAAALCLARAIARGVYHARPAKGDLLPSWCETEA